jgi:long-chain acyl-CoA synthetase
MIIRGAENVYPKEIEALRAPCARKLAGSKRPTSITAMDAIPKNAVGKTDKAPLRATHLRGTSP